MKVSTTQVEVFFEIRGAHDNTLVSTVKFQTFNAAFIAIKDMDIDFPVVIVEVKKVTTNTKSTSALLI